MTTNAGAVEMSRRSIGFTTQDHSSDGREAINKLFTPEFRNRLDAIIQFKPLSVESVSSVVSKFLFELENQLAEKNVSFSVDEEVRLWLAERGYDPKMGARPMARLIQEKIKKPLAEELLFGSLSQGSALAVDDAAFGQIVGGHLHLHLVAGEDADVVLAHLAGDVCRDHVAVLQLHPEHGVGEGLLHHAFHFDYIFFCHKPLLFL